MSDFLDLYYIRPARPTVFAGELVGMTQQTALGIGGGCRDFHIDRGTGRLILWAALLMNIIYISVNAFQITRGPPGLPSASKRE